MSSKNFTRNGGIVGKYIDRSGVAHGFLKKEGEYQIVDFPGSFDTERH
jgi:hypothetical protein